MVTDAALIRPITRSGHWRGLTGLTRAEARRWLPWRSLVLIGAGLLVLAAVFGFWWFAGSQHAANLRLGALMFPFFGLWAVVLTMATAAAAQGAVAGEVDEGTASWLVGMPIGRPAFILSKVLGAIPGVLATVFGTGLIAYPVISYASTIEIEDFTVSDIMDVASARLGSIGFTEMPTASEYLGMLARISLFLLVLVAVMVLLGSFFRSEALVLGLGVVIAVGFFFLGFLDVAAAVSLTPAGLISSLLDAVQADPARIAAPVAVSLLWIAVLTAIAILRFQRREL